MTQPPPVDSAQWFYLINQQQLGPVPTATMLAMISSGAVTGATLVWRQGMSGWLPAGSAPELAWQFSKGAPGARSKLAAGLLGVFLGAWGVHRFYLGFTGIGVAQIFVTLCTCGIGGLWGFIEGILILTGSINVDFEGKPLKD